MILPILIDLASGPRRIFAYLAADAFYYLTVARNIGEHGLVSFDGEHLTNGFHPAWQAIEGGLFALARPLGADDTTMLYVVLFFCLSLMSLALYLLARVWEDSRGRLPALFALTPLGIYSLLIAPLWLIIGDDLPGFNPFEGSAPLWGTLWHYVNGMETALALLAFGAMSWVFVRRPVLERTSSALLLGLAMGGLMLARLDQVFFALTLGVSLVWASLLGGRPKAAGRLVVGALVGALPVLAYLAWNQLEFGSMMPISGRVKTSFPHPIADNVQNVVALLGSPTPGWWLERATRETGLLIPAFFALVELLKGPKIRLVQLGRDPGARLDWLLRSSAWATLIIASYNGFFVRWGHQGHWYLPISTLLCTLWLLRWLQRIGPRLPWARVSAARAPEGARLWLRRGLLASVGALSVWAFLTLHRHEDTHHRFATLYLDLAPRIRAHYGDTPPRMVEFDDGIISYATGYRTMPNTALVLDAEAIEAVESGTLLQLAIDRGYNRFTSSVVDGPRVMGSALPFRDRYRVFYEMREPEIGFGIIAIEPRQPPAP